MENKISVVIPVFNEYVQLKHYFLPKLQELKKTALSSNIEWIFVDGGSQDGSYDLLVEYGEHVLYTQKGRSKQMNYGASYAKGDVVVFLHVDCWLSEHCLSYLCELKKPCWGFFNVKLEPSKGVLNLVQKGINFRSKFTSIGTGDQAFYLCKDMYHQVGGFPDQALMEDVTLCRRLLKNIRPVIINEPVIVSSRRWIKYGIVRTVFTMWLLQFAYFFGVSPERIHRWYYGDDNNDQKKHLK